MKKELLYRFFEGKASDKEIKEVKTWTELSEENFQLFMKERKLFDTIQVTVPLKKDNDKRGILYPKKRYSRLSWINNRYRIAAIVLIAICINITWIITKNIKEVQTAAQTIIVPPGQRVNIILPDGTDVWLNAGTTLQYPLSFLSNKREVILDGEAYFNVTRNKVSPFVVHTYLMDIQVLGTQFNVKASSEKNSFETSLIKGSVKLDSHSKKTEPIILTPGHKSILKNGQLETIKIENYDTYRWKEGLFCFHKKPFSDIILELEKYYDVNIEIQNPEIANVILTGKFRITEGLDSILRALQTNVNFKYHKDSEKNIIYIS